MFPGITPQRGWWALLSAAVRGLGTMAGNGGAMAEARQKSKQGKIPKSKAYQQAKSRTKGSAAAARKKRAKTPVRRETERERTVPADGAEELKRAADREVGQNSLELAEVLRKKAIKGDLASVKLLVTLAAQKKPIEKAVDNSGGFGGSSTAERWEAEPQCTDPLPGEEPEAGNKQ